MPAISVIVPVYKVEKYIHRCVDSVLGQTFADFELILVDDGSPDNCGAICDEYAAKDSRVCVIHQENGGLSAARNAGIDWAFANSNSEWLTFIDSDDWVHPEYLERLLDAAVTNNVSVSICGYAETQREELAINAQDLLPTLWNPEDFYVEHNVNAIVAWGKLCRKECFAEIRYPVRKIHEDEFTTYKILFKTDAVAVIPAPLYAYFQNPESITKSKWTPQRLDAIAAKKEQLSFFRQHNFNRAYTITAFKLLWTYASHIKQIEETPEIHYHLKGIRKKLRIDIRQYRSATGITIRENYDLYEVAYPKLMYIYWLMIVILKKLHLRK